MASNAQFVRADSTNLPRMESWMTIAYMNESNKYNMAEMRGAKALMSSRESYLDTSIGYVEVKRYQHVCTVRAKVVPEHRIRDKAYTVTITINEKEEEIMDAVCDGCAAALGGCKHTLVLIFWMQKKSSEPASTSVTCYWRKPRLLDARTEIVEAEDIFKNAKKIKLMPKDVNVLHKIQKTLKENDVTNNLVMCFSNEKQTLDKYNVFDMMLKFLEENINHSFEEFKKFSDVIISEEIKNQIALRTIAQTDAKLWHCLRQARITASQLYEAAHCQVDGSLVQQILGGYKVPETVAIKRGKKLEDAVVREVEKKLKVKIEKAGLVLIDGLIGASPDGVCKDFVVEIKCPSSEKTLKNYIVNNQIKPKFKAQLCLQMRATKKNKGLFCVADPKFETNKKVRILWVIYDQDFTDDLVIKSLGFWKKYIFPKILASAQC